MTLRQEFEKLIEKKRAEIQEHRVSIAAAEAYIDAMGDAIRKLPKEDLALVSVRKGSEIDKIREVLSKASRPMHLGEIADALGRGGEPDAKSRISGLLGWYTSRNKVFTKTAPNTYGLVEEPISDLPAEFGSDAPLSDAGIP